VATYSAEFSLFRKPSSYVHNVSGYPCFSEAAPLTSSSGPPLSSVYFFSTHDLTRPPRLVNTIRQTSFSITLPDSLAACTGPDACAGAPVEAGTCEGGCEGFCVAPAAPGCPAERCSAVLSVLAGGCGPYFFNSGWNSMMTRNVSANTTNSLRSIPGSCCGLLNSANSVARHFFVALNHM